jgi:8-oxo-dGTP pyrophosphatase MutT (NUDIX family)
MSKLLLTIRDEDIFPSEKLLEPSSAAPYKRIAVRFIILDESGDIALVRGKGGKYYLMPGGGVEGEESLEEAVRRECMEEVGCEIEILKEIGYTVEHRNMDNRDQETHCFIAKVVGDKGSPQSTQEDEIGLEVTWLSPSKALETLLEHKNNVAGYNGNFNVRAHIAFLNEYIEHAK